MSRPVPIQTAPSFEAYLEFLDTTQERYEFVDGNLFQMPGGTERHNVLAGRIIASAFGIATEHNCRLLFSDVSLKTPDETGYFPDLMLICDPSDNQARVKRKPCLIIEILSPSTEAIDRGEKLRRYCQIPSLQTYILLSQNEPRAEIYSRLETGLWSYEVLEQGSLVLHPLPLEIDLAVLYSNLPEN